MKTKIICIAAAIVCLLCGCQKKEDSVFDIHEVTGNFDFTVLKAGQADAIVLKTENHNIIIDCGEKDDGDKIAEYLAENGISHIDYLFITHFDKDHVGGFPETIKNVGVKNIIVPDYEGHNSEYKKYLKAVEENNLTATPLTEDTSFTLDDVLFDVSVPKKKVYAEEDNDFSLVISATHGENTFLFTGDAEKERIAEIVSEFKNQYDFLKVPHHGRYNENTKKLIDSVKPTYAVICDSKKNPAEEKTTDILKSAGSKIYHTKDGDINVSSNGTEIKITQ